MRNLLLASCALAFIGCGSGGKDATDGGVHSSDASMVTGDSGSLPVDAGPLPTKVSWDWQIGAATEAEIGVPSGVDFMDVDGFTMSAATVKTWKSRGIYTVCYINAGSYQPGLPDSADYPESLKLQADPNWPGEYFLDVTDVFKPASVLAQILGKRLDMCKAKGFDALEPDNLQNDENITSGQITRQAQLDFNGWIANLAHEKGLSVLQKNGPDQILQTTSTGVMMVDAFDGILNEQCQMFSECDALREYTKRGKLALDVEYDKSLTLDCAKMAANGVIALKKDLLLVGQASSGYLRETCN